MNRLKKEKSARVLNDKLELVGDDKRVVSL
jgi:hypothetical protein